MTFKPFWEALVPHMDKPMLIHFRWATHGLVDKDNCHPFKVAPDLAMIHNGIISGIEGVDALTSDTNAFVKHYVGPMNRGNPRIIYSEYGKLVLEKLIGSGSKLVFLNKKGKAVIINESAGNWENGVWYSNDSHLHLQVRYTTAYYGASTSYCKEARNKSAATANDIVGKPNKKKAKGKKKVPTRPRVERWVPKSERASLQLELAREVGQTSSCPDTGDVDTDRISTPTPSETMAVDTMYDPIEDKHGVFCPLVSDIYVGGQLREGFEEIDPLIDPVAVQQNIEEIEQAIRMKG